MKKIGFYIPTLGSGGAEKITLTLAKSFAENRYLVYLIAASAEGPLVKLIPDNVTLINLESARVLKSIIPLSTILKELDLDFLISSQTHASIAAYLAVLISGKKIPVIMREVSSPSINLKHLKGFRKYINKVVTRFFLKKAASIVCVSNGVKDDLESYLNNKFKNIQVIYNPVINDTMLEKSYEPIDLSVFKYPELPLILAVGRLTEAKNYSLLLKAFQKVIEQKKANLLIIGEGELRESLRIEADSLGLFNNIHFYGYSDNPYKYMRKCDVYVMSSNWEGLPGALVEGLALSKSVISTDCVSGPREILKNGEFGCLVEINNIEKMKCAILDALNNQKKIENLGLSEHLNEFKKEFVIDKYASLIKGICK